MCSQPLIAVNYGLKADGKKRIKIFLPHIGESYRDYQKRFGCENVFLIPCGSCPSCQLERRKEWSIRCALEAKCHLDNCFITLTYDEKNVVFKPIKRDLQLFIKNIRNLGYKVRYFGCGEVGSLGRSHYHIIIFGYLPKDMVYVHQSKSGEACYTSEEVNKCWNRGIAIVQYFSPAVGGYVAGYVSKKLGSSDGFILMSRRPGLGYGYFLDHKDELYVNDNIVDDLGSFKVVSNPRYFDKLAEKDGIDLVHVKERRIAKGRSFTASKLKAHKFEHYEDMFRYDRFTDYQKLKRLQRCL